MIDASDNDVLSLIDSLLDTKLDEGYRMLIDKSSILIEFPQFIRDILCQTTGMTSCPL